MPFPLVKMRFDPIRTVACRTGRQTGSAVTFPVTSTRARPWFALRTLTRSLGLANGWHVAGGKLDTSRLSSRWLTVPETCPPDLSPNPRGLRWLGLEVKAHVQQDADHATVRFVARSKLGGRAHRLQETSRFERRNGRWLYVDGETN